MNSTYKEVAIFEHKFWLQVLGDHARFLHDTLSPSEKELIREADTYIKVFDELLSVVSQSDLKALSKKADIQANNIRNFKLKIMEKQLLGKIKINLGPTFINHMVNEVEEYIRLLDYLVKEEVPPVYHELHYHLTWLLDATGHAGAVSENLDQVEKRLKEKSDEYMKHFEDFYLKAVEMTGYLRTNLQTFPALKRLNNDVALEMTLFKNFLNEIEELELTDQALGPLSALMADHMAREECYYLTKLAQTADTKPPNCDPTKPRTKDK